MLFVSPSPPGLPTVPLLPSSTSPSLSPLTPLNPAATSFNPSTTLPGGWFLKHWKHTPLICWVIELSTPNIWKSPLVAEALQLLYRFIWVCTHHSRKKRKRSSSTALANIKSCFLKDKLQLSVNSIYLLFNSKHIQCASSYQSTFVVILSLFLFWLFFMLPDVSMPQIHPSSSLCLFGSYKGRPSHVCHSIKELELKSNL